MYDMIDLFFNQLYVSYRIHTCFVQFIFVTIGLNQPWFKNKINR